MELQGYVIMIVEMKDNRIRLYGSPAERAELLVGDEIIEVNGKCLDEASHGEVIAYIHKCIRSRSINLRVKRRKEEQVTVPTDDVQNAYIVAVEEDAKRRLEELLYNHSLTPIDMTQHVGVESEHSEDLHNTSNSTTHSLEQAVLQSSMPYMTQSGHMTNGHVEMSEMNGYKEKEGKKGKGKKGKRSSTGSNETPLIDNLLTERKNNSQNSINMFGMDESYDDTHSSIEFDTGPHREMAIDVPKNFQGAVKTPPRFPSSHSSPRSTPTKESSAKNGKLNSNTPHSEEQMERIRRHQEEIRKRNEREEQRAKEQEFLRASLRRSDKMKALQKERKQAGIDNTAFIDNDDDSGGFEEGYVSGRHTQNSRDYMKKNLSYDDVLASLQHMKGKVNSKEGKEKLKFLTDFFDQRQFQNAVSVHHKVLDVKTRNPPVQCTCSNSQECREDSVEVLCSLQSPYSEQLLSILCKPHMKNLMLAHDSVARQEVKSANDQEPPDDFNIPSIPDGGVSVKLVHLEKTTEPLGATVRNDGESVIISRIVKGGTAEKSGLLHEGDEILDINGIDMKGKDINDVSEMLANMSGRITFTIYPSNEYNPTSATAGSIMHVKALFNYDPEDDLYIPCRELGLSFMKGDILHVITQEDPSWWQAYREGEEDYQSLAGLIPSRSFHEQRESMRQTIGTENKENQKKGRSCSCGRTNKKKKKRNMYKEEHEEILSYEEVAQYYPEPNRRRPTVLIGPPNVGRHELRQRLMESDYDRFAAAVPHTSRPRKTTGPENEHEIDGKDYHFVSRAEFETAIAGNKFIESGEYEKNIYGTSVEAVRQVINSGKICVLNTDPEALYMLHQTDLKPYVIFVYPPNIEKLRQIQMRLGVENIKDDDLREIIERAREMEDKFGHFFDYVLVNTDMDKAFDELLNEINRIEVEPQWVPITWTR
ncbi:protein PALS1-like isoform X2 [Mercenaria mercenaria]|uniref:protein PALS1-like isoform X2 n=1 Tax=Mercenaria mercenaria TaxID=6596 RepID=UPI00234F0864|nr:protein PALS1-like isoform X2 [Mercenaria mercenaria]